MKRVRNYKDNYREDNRHQKGRPKKHDRHNADTSYTQESYSTTIAPHFTQKTQKRFFFVNHENIAALTERQKALDAFKEEQFVCPLCGELITDIPSSMADKTTGKPIHFECAMAILSKEERLGLNEKICYIGGGRFGVLYFENPRDQRKFVIRKIINWEDAAHSPLRQRISCLYSQVE